MISCPNCQSKEYIGALFCKECGVQLVTAEGFESLSQPGTWPPGTGDRHTSQGTSLSSSETGTYKISLTILESGETLNLGNRDQISLGRVNPGQPIVPDIDLTPYHAYESGVSRLHASIRVQEGQVGLVDLSSANGTRINGKLIPPNETCWLENGDIVTLGKLKIRVLIND